MKRSNPCARNCVTLRPSWVRNNVRKKAISITVYAAVSILLLGEKTALSQLRRQVQKVEPERERHTISASSEMVLVPVSVLNEKGAPVRGLTLDRFRVFEDGVERQIVSFSQDDAPASIGIVFDASKSMETKVVLARQAVARLFEEAPPEDEFQLVQFNNGPFKICGLTRDTGQLRDALNLVAVKGWTALFDGVLHSAQLMRNATNSRKALVVLSDGQDNFSRHHESELRSYLVEAGLVVFSIGISDGTPSRYETRHLRRISHETGGSFYAGKMETLSDTVRSIGDAIRNQYLIGFRPGDSAADGKFRKIRVQLMQEPAAQQQFYVSWRTGYRRSEMR